MKLYSVTLQVETDAAELDEVYAALERGLNSMPATPYLEWIDLEVEYEGDDEEGEA